MTTPPTGCIAEDPFALLVGFALDQQVTVPTAFAGPLKIQHRLGRLDAAEIAGLEPARLDEVFREKPAVHRFPGAMATRVQELARTIVSEYDGDAAKVWTEAADSDDLRRRLAALPGFGEMKVKALASVLAKRFGLEIAHPLVPDHPDARRRRFPVGARRVPGAKARLQGRASREGTDCAMIAQTQGR